MISIFEHTKLGFCWWDLPVLILLILLIVVFVLQMKKLNDKKQDLKDRLAEKDAGKVKIE